DISAKDGAPVYSVSPGVVIRVRPDSITIGRSKTHRYGYWHIRPVVRSGIHVHIHQLLGHVIAGWGHVHLAESVRGASVDPLRRGALSPFHDRTVPTIDWVRLSLPDGTAVDPSRVAGVVNIAASIYDTPPIAPPAPWNVARLAPSAVWWTLYDGSG